MVNFSLVKYFIIKIVVFSGHKDTIFLHFLEYKKMIIFAVL